MKHVIGLILTYGPAPILIAALILHRRLQNLGLLNTRDLAFVGNESGTLKEYLTNVWYWDMFIGCLVILTITSLIIGPLMIRSYRKCNSQTP